MVSESCARLRINVSLAHCCCSQLTPALGLCAVSAGAGGRLATDPGLDTTADAGDLVCKDPRIQHN